MVVLSGGAGAEVTALALLLKPLDLRGYAPGTMPALLLRADHVIE